MQRWWALARQIKWNHIWPVMLLLALAASVAPPLHESKSVVGVTATTTSSTGPRMTAPPSTATQTTTPPITTGTTGDTTLPASTEPAPETTVAAAVAPPSEPPQDVARSIPAAAPAAPPPAAPPPSWASSVATTSAGYISTSVGCASDTGAGALDAFFAARVGPLMGADYQHVVALGGNRFAWFFQDAFIDPSGAATRLDQSFFAHNLLLIQDGKCFTMLHRGKAAKPTSFEPGNGESPLSKWFWPMGAETSGGQVKMFWAEMTKDPYDPGPGDGLGWHPTRVWLATYDAHTMKRLAFDPAPNSSPNPIYGYAVANDGAYSYLFGNTFEQNLVREGGFFGGQHSATAMYLARVPVGQLNAAPEYRAGNGSWSPNPGDARPFVQRYWAENPMQPRFIDGQWAAATKVDGYWGEQLVIEVANHPWGPWTATEFRNLSPRGGDGLMNTYHAHLLPYRSSGGALIVTVSQNARQMTDDAFPHPERYRIAVFTSGWAPPPADPPPPTTTTPTTTSTTSTTTTSTTTTSTIPVSNTTTSTPANTTTTAPTTTAPTTTTPTTTTTPASTTSTSTTSTSTTSTSTTSTSTTTPTPP